MASCLRLLLAALSFSFGRNLRDEKRQFCGQTLRARGGTGRARLVRLYETRKALSSDGPSTSRAASVLVRSDREARRNQEAAVAGTWKLTIKSGSYYTAITEVKLGGGGAVKNGDICVWVGEGKEALSSGDTGEA